MSVPSVVDVFETGVGADPPTTDTFCRRPASMEKWCTVGMRVEVFQTEEGLAGSYYAAQVIQIEKKQTLVEYEV